MGEQIKDVDAVVLDLDGVLVDVSESYRRAVKESVEIVYGLSVEDSLIQGLKDVGGFNNDWKVTYACALFVLAQNEQPGLDSGQWLSEIDDGAGLSGAVDALDDLLPAVDREWVKERWNREKLWNIFQELYLGSEQFSQIEERPAVLERTGFINEEPIIVQPDVLDWLIETFEVGVLTGRPRREAEFALERIEWELPSDRLLAMEDWDKEKPSPEGLLRLADDFNATTVVYVGDTLDDVRTARNAEDADSERTIHGIGVLTGGLTGEAGRSKYETTGARAVVHTVNEVPELIGESSAP